MSGTKASLLPLELSELWPVPDPRTLRLDFLRLTRGYSGPRLPWELNRGFRLLALEPGWFLLFLGARALVAEADPLATQPGPPEEAFLIGVPPVDADEGWLRSGRDHLGELAWASGVVALLGDYRQRKGRLAPLYRASREVFSRSLTCGAAFWVWQPMPQPLRRQGLAFFALEQQLYQWGRVGRRVARRCKWRRLWPW